jgi:hypothetical protein
MLSIGVHRRSSAVFLALGHVVPDIMEASQPPMNADERRWLSCLNGGNAWPSFWGALTLEELRAGV